MISSKALKNFVKAHERKLNAKIDQADSESAIDSGIEQAHWGADCIDDRHHHDQHTHHRQSTSHWGLNQTMTVPTRNRPKSSYFNFILTPTH